MIVIRTGLPGAGKSLFALHDYVVRPPVGSAPSSRVIDGVSVPIQVFVSGFSGLDFDRLPGVVALDEPTRWMDCPPGSVVVIDEAQRLFRPRSPGAPVPEHVSALETHRHLGIDIVLITQDPMLLDAHVRRLAGEHFHLKRTFGLNSSTQYRWQECKQDPRDYHAKKEAEKSRRKFPKNIYSYYKSAEVHTVKKKIPLRAWLTLGFLLCLFPVGFYVYYRVSHIAASALGNHSPAKVTHVPTAPVFVPSVAFPSQHPLNAFHQAALKVRRHELASLPAISERFRLVSDISMGARRDYVAISSSGHYEMIPTSSCRSLNGLEVCKWGGAYVSVNPVRPHHHRHNALPPPSTASSTTTAANPVQGLLP